MTTFYAVLETTIIEHEIDGALVWPDLFPSIEAARAEIVADWHRIQEEDGSREKLGLLGMNVSGDGMRFSTDDDTSPDRILWVVCPVTPKGD